MSGPQKDKAALEPDSQDDRKPMQYPTDHIVGVLDTPDQASCAVDALAMGGFLESEIKILHGPEEAERVDASTGRRGLQDWWIRAAQRLGLENAETEVKERYEKALRDGHTVIAILAPTEERKDRAANLLRECGGHFINFFGRLAVQRLPG
jgi:hypothetical protein